MSSLLELIDLKRHFGGLWATDGVNLSISRGEIHALIGPNGAGKTTLIHLVSGALQPDSGSIWFAGHDVSGTSMHQRVALGITRSYQITQIFPRLTLQENVRLAVQARQRDFGSSFRFWQSVETEEDIAREAEQWLAHVGLGMLPCRFAADVSHGERRALELAMTLATRPQLLLLDEPMAGMGPEESEMMATLISSLKGEQTVLLIEHDIDIVFRLADRISVLVSGRVVASGTPEFIRTHPEVRVAYLGETAS